MTRIIAPKIVATVFASLAVLAVVTTAHADTDKQEECSVATLKGSFGYTVTGALVTESGAEPFAAVGRLTFDGAGNFENIRTISRNGNILLDVEGVGTYTVDPDCTGSFTFTDGGVVTLSTDIVIDDHGNELRMIATSPGTVLTVIGRKQFPGRGRG
jgi:hypothetical protein